MRHGFSYSLQYHHDDGGQIPAYPASLPYCSQEDVATCNDYTLILAHYFHMQLLLLNKDNTIVKIHLNATHYNRKTVS